ncbi:nad dependent epimerase dehydratase [Diaporthe amygdali]|uniref:nad dependent epimerase dehydratase n=1 Tax=Phomopsis amygdali TaxID=1214568 RepID=UPI0022FEF66B|nr:nad dependent epimerase dehydratase [Diaporthe amygdali]KAJ0114816.1 nad dependent epimerase dehydratase [Diaporthe amygdali]
MAPSVSSTDLVLITGATGHVGFRTLVHALRTGLNVRVAVRSQSKASQLLSRLCLKITSKQRQRLSFTVVPDITADGAYDNAMDDVTHVIHVASPLVTGSQQPPIDSRLAEDFFIGPAVRGTRNLLEASESCGTVRRVVITSSIVALIPVAQMEGTEPRPKGTPVRPTDRVPFTSGPYHSEFAAYANSKIAALHAAETWCETTRPAFDVVHLHPSFVLGRNDMAANTAQCMKGTNAMVLAMLLGRRFGPFAGATVHVDDVARCHVTAAIDTINVSGNESYILSQESRWNDAKDMAIRSFPVAEKTRLLVKSGNVDTTEIEIDGSLAEDTFGLRFKGFQDQVESLVGQFLDLKSNKGQGGPKPVSGKGKKNTTSVEVKVYPTDMPSLRSTAIFV